MKNARILLFALVVCFSLVFVSACSFGTENGVSVDENNSKGDVSQDGSNGGETDKGSASANKDVTVNEQVLLDQDGIVIKLKSLETDGLFGPALKVLIENGSDKDITVQTRDVAVNGVMVESMFSSDVAAGKSANDEIVLLQSDLDTAGIEVIKDIEFRFSIFDPESFETIFESETVNVGTSADPSYVQTYDDSGFLALDQNGFKVVVKKLDNEESFWGADLYVYIENNSQTNATIQVSDVSVNGFMIEPIFSSDVLAGKKAYDSITFLESDLTDNDIASIDNIEMNFQIFNTETMDTILESEIISVSFAE